MDPHRGDFCVVDSPYRTSDICAKIKLAFEFESHLHLPIDLLGLFGYIEITHRVSLTKAM